MADCTGIDLACVKGLGKDGNMKQANKVVRAERLRLEHEESRRILNEYYNTTYFDTVSTKYSPAPVSATSDPREKVKALKELAKRKALRPPHPVKIPSERYGEPPDPRPWEPGVKKGNNKRTGVYVGILPTRFAISTQKENPPFDLDTTIPGDIKDTKSNCRFYHCLLPANRGRPPYENL